MMVIPCGHTFLSEKPLLKLSSVKLMSIPSLTIPPSDPRGFAHSSCPRGRVFTPLSCPGVYPGFCPGVLNQSKSSIILKKARFLLCLLNNRVAALFICLYMLEASSVTYSHLHYNKHTAYQNLSR